MFNLYSVFLTPKLALLLHETNNNTNNDETKNKQTNKPDWLTKLFEMFCDLISLVLLLIVKQKLEWHHTPCYQHK